MPVVWSALWLVPCVWDVLRAGVCGVSAVTSFLEILVLAARPPAIAGHWAVAVAAGVTEF